MEIKAELLKPFNEKEKMNFIVRYNHNLGYEIKETSEALEAWGLTEEEIKQREIERIGNLTATKRVFALILNELGIDYLTQLKPLIESNPAAQLEWELCSELQRKNPLIDIMAEKMGISSTKIDKIFRYANNEITAEELKEGEQELN